MQGELRNSIIYPCHYGQNRIAYQAFADISTHPRRKIFESGQELMDDSE